MVDNGAAVALLDYSSWGLKQARQEIEFPADSVEFMYVMLPRLIRLMLHCLYCLLISGRLDILAKTAGIIYSRESF